MASVRREQSVIGPLAIMAVVAASLVTGGLTLLRTFAPGVVSFEHTAADYRTALLADRRADLHPDVVVVTVGDETLSRHAGHPYRSPTDRAVLARLVSILDRAEPRVIGLDYLLDRPTEPDKDRRLTAALAAARSRVVLAVADERAGLSEEELAFQDRMVASSGKEAGHAHLVYDRDEVVRYLPRPHPRGRYPLSFAEAIATGPPSSPAAAARRPVAPIAAGDHRNHRIAWIRVDDSPPELSFKTIPAETLLDAEAKGETRLLTVLGALLRGRIVIVGGDFPDLDRHETPLGAIGAPKLQGALLHAHMAAQFIDRRAVTHAASWAEPILTMSLCLLGILVGMRYNLVRFSYPLGTAVLIGLDVLTFLTFRIILPFTLPLLAWVAGAWIGRNSDLVVALIRPRRPRTIER